MRQLSFAEIQAVQTVYFAPKEMLAALGFLFPNLEEAAARLIEEPDEDARTAYFRRAVALFKARSQAIAEHIAAHVDGSAERETENGPALALSMLTRMRADDNFDGDWNTETGAIPNTALGSPTARRRAPRANRASRHRADGRARPR